MSKSKIAAILLAGMLGLGVTTGLAHADDEDDASGRGWGIGRLFGWGGGMMGPEDIVDRIDGRLAYMKTELKVTDAQTAAWDEFANIVKMNAETHNAMMKDMMDKTRDGSFFKQPLPDRLTIQETHLSARLEQVKATKLAADKLYALLTAEQKAVADEIVLPTMGMGPGHRMGRRMMFWN